VARDHDLTGIVVVGDRADFALRGRFDHGLGDGEVGAEQGRHRPLADRHRRLHRLAALLQQTRGGGEIEGAGRAQRGIFAQRMTGDEICLGGELDTRGAQCRHRIGHDRRLGVLGQHQLFGRALTHQPRQILAQRLVRLLEDGACLPARPGQRRAHADRLAPLPREDECAHRSCLLFRGGW